VREQSAPVHVILDLQILSDNPGNDAHCHAMLFINPCHSEAHIILLAWGAVVVAGVRHSIDTIGEADVDDTFMYVRHLVAHGEALMGVPDLVPGKVTGHDGALYPEHLHPDHLFRQGNDPCLHRNWKGLLLKMCVCQSDFD